MTPKKITIFPILLSMLLISSFAGVALTAAGATSNQNDAQFALAHSAPASLSDQDRVLASSAVQFLTEIFKLNMSSYNVTVQNTAPAPFGEFMTLSLKSDTSTIDVLTEFSNSDLVWCMLEPVNGSPAYSASVPSDIVATAINTLDKIQAISPKTYISSLQNILSSTSSMKNSVTKNADYVQEIVSKENDVTIKWEPAANGLHSSQNNLMLEFKNGQLVFFENFLSLYTIGSSDAKISEQDAINIAIQQVQAFSWVQGSEAVSNVTVLSSPVIANLTLENRGNATLYPYWDVWLPLDRAYPGGVTAFHVSIWADTGEVAYVTPIGSNGNSAPVDNEVSQANSLVANYSLAITISIIAIVVVIVGCLFYKRRR